MSNLIILTSRDSVIEIIVHQLDKESAASVVYSCKEEGCSNIL